ncbi:hypothetical protein [Vibrio cholerae]|uniref:hypothetical protein n=1 Tax=Vibrio cholerae TaxID=666 RepID=UPI001159D2DA|nr:hypothetical protein [Vibrio cholerae]EGR0892039.1 hypothetical protein [Vibrio cholerae]ELF6904134.1 hypothetical protein [Vibrio cholerae]TQP37540.1 hypothetical protein FLL92_03495 [Vibrio cholerae]TQP61566.1 hypothetical protein FLL81_07300 [Vibrio cholerae]TQQ19018.1 hypothetical protein FLL85_17830 [Vibrio cholerae]
MTRAERIAAAKQRLLSRYPDRDEQESTRMESFKGLTKEELEERFKKAAEERGIIIVEREQKQLDVATH